MPNLKESKIIDVKTNRGHKPLGNSLAQTDVRSYQDNNRL